MKKIMTLFSAFMLSVVALTACAPSSANSSSAAPSASTSNSAQENKNSEARELNLFTWENMIPQSVLKDFTKETGIQVNFTAFDTDETMLAKLAAAKGGEYDFVIADDYIIEAAIEQGLVKKLDKSKLTNLENINPIFQGQFYDKNDEYTVPYSAGVQTIVYNPQTIKKEITGYADLWDESLKGKLGIVGNYRVINGMALKVLGESYNVEDVSKIEQAGKKLMELAPNIRLIKDDSLQEDLLSGEIDAAVMYTSQVTLARMANPDLKIVYPKEGIGFGVLAEFIPVNAPHAEEAYELMNYLMRPEVSKKYVEEVGYYSVNTKGDALIQEEYQEFLTLPKEFKPEQMEMVQNISADANEAHVKAWTEFKSKAGA